VSRQARCPSTWPKVAGLTWPPPEHLDDEGLEARLFPHEHQPARRCPAEPDWALIHLELKKKHVTLILVWQEYREQHADGLQYSRFCERYRAWAGGLGVTMRQRHRAGEKMFVDFSGDGIDIVDERTGESSCAKLFIAVLGGSNLTYIEPVLSEDLPTWIGCHIRAFEYFGGVPEVAVPDNLKSGVKRPCYYEPDVNQTYNDLAQHYSFAVIPARVRKPRDKAKAEQGVLLAERWVIAALRHHRFSSLAQVAEAVLPLLERLNNKPMRQMKKSRREVFDEVEKATLRPLPAVRFTMSEWKKVKVNIDYHVEFDEHYYSVHYSYYSQNKRDMEVRATAATVEILWRGRRIASHVRSYKKYDHTTLRDHMPESHRQHSEWTPSRLVDWGRSVGPMTGTVVEEIMRRRAHPEQGYRACLGLLRLRKSYSGERIESACAHAVKYGTYSYQSIKAILKNNRDQLCPDADGEADAALPWHRNIRGPGYYQ
jgi:transposase